MGLDSGLQVLVLQMVESNLPRRTEVSKRTQTKDNYKILELKVTSNCNPCFQDHFVVYMSREGKAFNNTCMGNLLEKSEDSTPPGLSS